MVGPGKFKVKSKSTKLLSERKYLGTLKICGKINYLIKNLSQTQLTEIYTREGKGIAASTLKLLPAKNQSTENAVQEWVNKGKRDSDSIVCNYFNRFFNV